MLAALLFCEWKVLSTVLIKAYMMNMNLASEGPGCTELLFTVEFVVVGFPKFGSMWQLFQSFWTQPNSGEC